MPCSLRSAKGTLDRISRSRGKVEPVENVGKNAYDRFLSLRSSDKFLQHCNTFRRREIFFNRVPSLRSCNVTFNNPAYSTNISKIHSHIP